MHYTEYDTRLAAYAAMVNDENAILLTWFNGGPGRMQPCWSLPGGGVEFDESIKDAVVRETWEETGYVVQVGAVVALNHFTVTSAERSRPFRAQHFLLDARITGGRLGTVEVGGTTDFARWVPLADFPLGERAEDIVHLAVRYLQSRS